MSEAYLGAASPSLDSQPLLSPREAAPPPNMDSPDADAADAGATITSATATAFQSDDLTGAADDDDAAAAAPRTLTLAIRSRPLLTEEAPVCGGDVSLGPLFEVLTFDLRYQIYQMSFGGKILHLYLLYRRSLQPDVRWRKGHQPVPAWYPHSPGVSPMDPPCVDASMAPQWYWWSCVCGPEDRRLETKLGDQCPRGFFQTCGPKETYLGVLPWLLTCRRAYEETIKVLYASNTFKFEQRLEAMYFPYAIITPHLNWITSLEIRIPDRDESLTDRSLDKAPRPPSASSSSASGGIAASPLITDLRALSPRDQYLHIIKQIAPSTYPALRRLHIAFEGSIRRVPVPKPNVTTLLISTLGEVDADELADVILGPIDALPQEIEKQVVFYQSLYTALLAAEQRQKGGEEEERVKEVEYLRSDGRPGWTKFWRSLKNGHDSRAGYWVCKHG